MTFRATSWSDRTMLGNIQANASVAENKPCVRVKPNATSANPETIQPRVFPITTDYESVEEKISPPVFFQWKVGFGGLMQPAFA